MKYFLLSVVVFASTIAFAEYTSQIILEHHDQDPWVVITNKEYPNQAIAMTREINDKNNNPILDVGCSLPSHQIDGEEFEMQLIGSSNFKAENDLWIEVVARVDKNSPITMGWHIYEGRETKLEASTPNLVLSDMVNGEKIHFRFRDVDQGLQEYSYGLKNFSQAVNKLEEICKYKYDGK